MKHYLVKPCTSASRDHQNIFKSDTPSRDLAAQIETLEQGMKYVQT